MLPGMIDATDLEIDRLAYELCGLTEDEVTVVEGLCDVHFEKPE